MRPEEKEISIDERRSRLERRANVIRSRLLRTIDALDVRRHQVTQIGVEAKRLARPALAATLGIVAVAFAAAMGLRAALRKRRARSLPYRVARFLEPLRPAPRRPSILEDALRKGTTTLVSMVVAEAARRATKNAFDGRSPMRGHVALQEMTKAGSDGPRVLPGATMVR